MGRLYLLPLTMSILLPITITATYVASILSNHLKYWIPLISDTGAYPPESCFFSQFVNIIAALGAVLVTIRYQQLISRDPTHQPSPWLLKSGLWTGFLSSLGMSIIANFQISNLELIHNFGGFMTYAFGISYFWIQTKCTYFDPPERFNKKFIRLRLCICIILSVCFVINVIGLTVSYLIKGGIIKYMEKTSYDEGYRKWFLLGTSSEWIMSLCMSIFMTTFIRDFKCITFQLIQK